ncbi:hypothetical protein DFH94DRAFT_716835 [Russula ochroleuca]|jgi:deoxyribodipyrimidine photolyase|uniref:Cryptochrome/DNA photolyase FAD-binding domain-containing protein n=1 Tax=Russula ochroleuca TaxID=152965 RepID=A0A9P5TCX5_9AGAM|nr:hypothetical protein DFH94DRAFT_716835 [Russula ochroleuca]
MIAAIYLTKDPVTGWASWCESKLSHLKLSQTDPFPHFMQHLIDGDLASNNGSWQWRAITGTDPNHTLASLIPE